METETDKKDRRNKMDVEESLICPNCSKIVRPIDVPTEDNPEGNRFHTCPVCKRSLEKAIDRHERRYGLKPNMETDLPDRGDEE